MKKLLPHEIDGFTNGKTTYAQAVKLLGKPLKRDVNKFNGSSVATWCDRQVDGAKWRHRNINAQFDEKRILRDYRVQQYFVPQFGFGFR